MTEIFSFLTNSLLTVFTVVLIFSLLIILHEFGHFWAARRAKIQVLEFGFGLPPKLWSKKTTRHISYTDIKGNKKKKSETMEWSLNAIPFGGFVRMLGEDEREKNDSPFAFGNRPLGWRILVVCGGVMMNVILGWFLLSFGYLVGMTPLFPVTSEEKIEYMEKGLYSYEKGVFFLWDESITPEGFTLQNGDMILKIGENQIIDESHFFELLSGQGSDVSLTIKRYNRKTLVNEELILSVPKNFLQNAHEGRTHLLLSRVIPGSIAESSGLQKGDILRALNGESLMSYDDFLLKKHQLVQEGVKDFSLTVERKNKKNGKYEQQTIPLTLDENGNFGVYIGNIIVSPRPIPIVQSDEAGELLPGDRIVQIDTTTVRDMQHFESILSEKRSAGEKTITFHIERVGEEGVETLSITKTEGEQYIILEKVLFEESYIPQTLTEKSIAYFGDHLFFQKPVRFSVLEAPVKAVRDSIRFLDLSLQTITGVVKSIFLQFTLPDEVGGPVGIAHVTYQLVQFGNFSFLLQLAAVLSFSLAVLNIMPFPALDGGRLLFLLIEGVLTFFHRIALFLRLSLRIPQKIPPEWETPLHVGGYLLLMIFLILVTLQDIDRIWG